MLAQRSNPPPLDLSNTDSLKSPSPTARKPCPFCQKEFIGLGNHLPRCKERQGRDYSIYLSQKTLAKRSSKATLQTCPHCHKLFRRLDTHLQRNARCKRIADCPQPSSRSNTDNVLPTSPDIAAIDHEQGEVQPGRCPLAKGLLSLPKEKEEWRDADTYFAESLVPRVQQASNVTQKMKS